MTTQDLIDELKRIDPDGKRHVVLEIVDTTNGESIIEDAEDARCMNDGRMIAMISTGRF